jgi:hypothetical protein
MYIIILLSLLYDRIGFIKLEGLWVAIFTIIILLFLHLNKNQKIILISIICLNKTLSTIIILFLGILISIGGGHFETYRLMSTILFKYKFNLHMNINDIPKSPTIFIANYPCTAIEYLSHGLFGKKVALLVTVSAANTLKYIYGSDNVFGIEKHKFQDTQYNIQKKLQSGYHIIAYIEDKYYKRKNIYSMSRIRNGLFSIAKNINATITPVAIDHIDHTFGILSDTLFKIKIGSTFKVNDVKSSVKNVEFFFSKNLKHMSIKKQIIK